MSYPFKLHVTFLITILLTSYIIADCFFRSAAFEDSNIFTITLQKNGSNFIDQVFIIFCDILTPIVMAVLLIMYYIIFPGKLKTLSFIIYFIFIIYLTSLLKMFYNDPRPYWENSEIIAKECSTDYGNPSGHSLSAVLLFGIIWYRYFRYFVQKNTIHQKISQNADVSNVFVEQKGRNENIIFVHSELNQNEQKEANAYIKTSLAQHIEFLLCSIAILFITFLILFGRIYLGMHSYNEVLLGAFYGFYFLILYIFYFEILLMQILEAIIKGNDQAIRDGKLLNWLYLAYLIAIYVLLVAISIITYEISYNNIQIPIIHNKNIDKYCSDRTMHKRFFYVGFTDCGIIAGPVGLLIGLLLTRGQYETLAKVYKKKLIPTSSNEKSDSFNLFIKILGRIVIGFIIYGLPAGLLSIISISNIYGSFFINNNLSLLIGTIFLIKVMPFAFFKLKLEKNGDLLCYRENKMIIIDDEGDKLRIKPIYLY